MAGRGRLLSELEHIFLVSETPDLYHRSPDSSNLRYRLEGSDGWWGGIAFVDGIARLNPANLRHGSLKMRRVPYEWPANRLLHHSTLCSRVIKKKKKMEGELLWDKTPSTEREGSGHVWVPCASSLNQAESFDDAKTL